MSVRGGWVAGLALVLAAACQPAPRAMSDAQRSAIADSVRTAHRALFATFPGRNIDSIMAYFSGDLTFAEEGMIYPSRDSLKQAATGFLAATRAITITTSEPKIVVLGPDGAALTATFHETITDTAGGTMELNAAWSAVYRRESGRWMIAQSHESFPGMPPVPPAAPPRRH